MLKYTNEQQVVHKLFAKTCDRCNKTSLDAMEYQEWIHIEFIGGYNSIFGDGNIFECDFCQECMKELFGKYLNSSSSITF